MVQILLQKNHLHQKEVQRCENENQTAVKGSSKRSQHVAQKEVKTMLKWRPTNAQTMVKWSLEDGQTERKWSLNGAEMKLERCSNDFILKL